MNAADFVAEMESRFRCVQGPYRNRCQTGERYVQIGVEIDHPMYRFPGEPPTPSLAFDDNVNFKPEAKRPGILREGVPSRHYPTEHEACMAALEAFNAYEKDWRQTNPNSQPVLYWRYDAAHAFWHPDESGKDRGRLKVRLVLSDKPTLELSDEAYDLSRREELEAGLKQSV